MTRMQPNGDYWRDQDLPACLDTGRLAMQLSNDGFVVEGLYGEQELLYLRIPFFRESYRTSMLSKTDMH
jgi:hypothetical protein